MTCECFRCHKGYESVDPDDAAGDGKCADCKELTKKIALMVDLNLEKRRKENPLPSTSRIRQLFSEEEILKGEIVSSRRINVRDLGIL